jgi:hypothetical protein
MSLADLRDEIRLKINDTQTDTLLRHWSDTQLNSRINIIQEQIANLTKCHKDRARITPVVSQVEYNLLDISTNCIKTYRVSYRQSTALPYKTLTYVTEYGLDVDLPSWDTTPAGIPSRYYERGMFIGLIPASSSTVPNGISIEFYSKPNGLISDTDVPFNNDPTLFPFHEIIVWGVARMCKEDESKLTEAQAYENKYYGMIKTMADDIVNRPDRNRNAQMILSPR